MTNDEAINTLKNTAWLGWDKQKEKVTEAVRMAVEALKRETSGDAISRHDAIDALMEILDRPNHAEFLYTDEICKALNELPSAQPERTDKHTETHACDCISRQGAIDADELMELLTTAIRNMKGIAKLIGAEDDPEIKMKIKAYTDIANWVKDAPTIEPELTWHECFDDDPASFPDNERNVLVSFSNFSLSIIGQWRVDEDGAGCWYLGDTDETFLSEDLFVDGWWELPKKPERSN